jgi:nitrile hydratase
VVRYRSRTVREPRAVLAEFGTVIPAGTRITVHDSTADMRYLVLPRRPDNTEHLDEMELATLVTRDSMIGVSVIEN